MNILEDFYCPAALDNEYKFSESGIYHQMVPEDSDHKVSQYTYITQSAQACIVGALSFVFTYAQTYMTYIRALPINDTPEMFGLHDNANITFALNETSSLLEGFLKLQPKTASGSGHSREEV